MVGYEFKVWFYRSLELKSGLFFRFGSTRWSSTTLTFDKLDKIIVFIWSISFLDTCSFKSWTYNNHRAYVRNTWTNYSLTFQVSSLANVNWLHLILLQLIQELLKRHYCPPPNLAISCSWAQLIIYSKCLFNEWKDESDTEDKSQKLTVFFHMWLHDFLVEVRTARNLRCYF